MATPRERYQKALDDVMKRFGRLDHQTVRRLIALLQEVRQRLAADIALAGDTLTAANLAQTAQSVEIIIASFNGQLTGELNRALTDGFSLGQASVTDPLNTLNLNLAPTISPQLANVAIDFSAELVTGITEDLRKAVNTQLRLATLAQQTPFQAMQGITQALGLRAKDGVFGRRNRPEVVKGVAARAETIVRTEMTRIFNLANNSQQQEAAATVPGLLKRWVATPRGNTRQSHLAAHRRYSQGPIPVDEPFQVGGDLLMFPGDPAGSAEETINCRCSMTTIHPGVGVIATPLDANIEREHKRRQREKEAA